MPAVYLTEAQAREARATKFLKIAILNQGTNQKALAKKINMPYMTLHKRIVMPETCTFAEMWRILDALEVPEEERGQLLA